MSAVDDMWPAVSASSNIDTNSQTVLLLSSEKSFSKHAQSLWTDPGINKKPPRKPVIGKSKDRKLTSVVTSRTVELFISRLHRHTSCNEVKECADSIA